MVLPSSLYNSTFFFYFSWCRVINHRMPHQHCHLLLLHAGMLPKHNGRLRKHQTGSPCFVGLPGQQGPFGYAGVAMLRWQVALRVWQAVMFRWQGCLQRQPGAFIQ
jgi:hypothetical protein